MVTMSGLSHLHHLLETNSRQLQGPALWMMWKVSLQSSVAPPILNNMFILFPASHPSHAYYSMLTCTSSGFIAMRTFLLYIP